MAIRHLKAVQWLQGATVAPTTGGPFEQIFRDLTDRAEEAQRMHAAQADLQVAVKDGRLMVGASGNLPILNFDLGALVFAAVGTTWGAAKSVNYCTGSRAKVGRSAACVEQRDLRRRLPTLSFKIANDPGCLLGQENAY